MTKRGFVVAYDTLVDGWQCERDAESGTPVIYATEAEAQAEIDAQKKDIEDCEDFVVPVEEFLNGRKFIWSPKGITILGEPI